VVLHEQGLLLPRIGFINAISIAVLIPLAQSAELLFDKVCLPHFLEIPRGSFIGKIWLVLRYWILMRMIPLNRRAEYPKTSHLTVLLSPCAFLNFNTPVSTEPALSTCDEQMKSPMAEPSVDGITRKGRGLTLCTFLRFGLILISIIHSDNANTG